MKIAYLVDFMPQNVVMTVILHIRCIVSYWIPVFWQIWTQSRIEGRDRVCLGVACHMTFRCSS